MKMNLSALVVASIVVFSCGSSSTGPSTSSGLMSSSQANASSSAVGNSSTANASSANGSSAVSLTSSSGLPVAASLYFSDSTSYDTTSFLFIYNQIHIALNVSSDSIYLFQNKTTLDSIKQSTDKIQFLSSRSAIFRTSYSGLGVVNDWANGQIKYDPTSPYSAYPATAKFYVKQVGATFYYIDQTKKQMYKLTQI